MIDPDVSLPDEIESETEAATPDPAAAFEGDLKALGLDDEGVAYRPRPYQVEGAHFLAERKRAFLADAPGLGKTLAAAIAARPYGKTLVVCPTYLVEQWADFIAENWPGDTIGLAKGDPLKRHFALTGDSKWYVMNTEALRSYYPPEVTTVIFDEAHYLRNKGAKQSKYALKLAERTERVYELSATPIYRDTSDLWHLMHILDPKKWTSYWEFIDMYCNLMHTGYGERVVSTKNRELLEWWMNQYIIGRTYKDVEMQLPDMVEKPIHLEETPEFYKRYARLRDNYIIDEIPLESAAAVLHELRRMTVTDAKIHAIKAIVDDVPSEQPVVIFCWYKDTAARIAAEFGVEALTGDIAPNDRAKAAKATRVRVATLAALSEGVDLSDARTVIIAEYDYTPGRMYQATSRVRRYSFDSSPVILYSVRTKRTVDDVVYHAVQARISSAHRILREALED